MTRRETSGGARIELPLIKEHRAERLLAILKHFSRNPFDRDRLRESTLKLYKGKEEKSVFRGMVIPSLRHLGLIVGYDEDIRLSANGTIIAEALKKPRDEGLRALRTILIEIDDAKFGFVKTLMKYRSVEKRRFKKKQADQVQAPSLRQAEERSSRWIALLLGSQLLLERGGKLCSRKKNVFAARKDLDARGKKDMFKEVFFRAYRTIVKKQENIPLVDIEDLRAETAKQVYAQTKMILTERQFDKLLSGIPHAANTYIISFGRPMGAEEKLFQYRGKAYRTLSIRFV